MKLCLRSTATLFLGPALTSVCKFAKLIQLKNREKFSLPVTLQLLLGAHFLCTTALTGTHSCAPVQTSAHI